MTQYDLTLRYCTFLDPHLTFPLLEFLCGRNIHAEKQILSFILDTVSKTNMIDYTMDTRKRLYMGDVMSEDLIQRKMEVIHTLKSLQRDVAPIMNATDVLKKGGGVAQDKRSFVSALQRDFNFQAEHLENAYKLAKYLYECGNYHEASSYLYFCLIVMTSDDKNYLSVLWGKLASEILILNWNTAMEDMIRLRCFIDDSSFEPMKALQQRAWLIHWSILIFFNHPKGREELIEMFLYKNCYLNAIQTVCPHILRYLVTAVVMNYTPRNVLNDVVKIIEQETYAYRDPITELLERLLVHFDFEGARLKLQECQMVILNDFFIEGCLTEFIEGARMLIFETYCRIHKTITISMLADKLSMTADDAECWIVNMIRNARLDAKIDSKQGHVLMGTQPPGSQQQIAERIDSLCMRSEHLAELVERLIKQRAPASAEGWKYVKGKLY